MADFASDDFEIDLKFEHGRPETRIKPVLDLSTFSGNFQWTQAAFRGLFRRNGLPEIIRVDNGAPFASMGPRAIRGVKE